jgi:hypothetical protein
MRILILEDDKNRIEKFVDFLKKDELDITDSAYAAVELLRSNIYDAIFLDHDLGDGNGSGSFVSSFLRLCPENIHNADVIIHSWNVPAARNMVSDIPQAVVAPFNTKGFVDLIKQRGYI